MIRACRAAPVDGLEADLPRERRDHRLCGAIVADDRDRYRSLRDSRVQHRFGAQRAEGFDHLRARRETRDALGVGVCSGG